MSSFTNASDVSFSQFSTDIFKILAGPERKSLYAHKDFLGKSDMLCVLMLQASFEDSKNHQINLEDWDEETVNRLLEYLYTNDYSSPLPSLLGFEKGSDVIHDTPCPSKIVILKLRKRSDLSVPNARTTNELDADI